MKAYACLATAAFLGGAWAADARAEIYACEGEDGITSYQDQPCPEPASAEPAEPGEAPEPQAPTESGSPPGPPEPSENNAPPDPELVAACKKRYRDAIDQLDAEIRNGMGASESEAFRRRARALSQQLGRCDYDPSDTASGDGGPEPPGRDL